MGVTFCNSRFETINLGNRRLTLLQAAAAAFKAECVPTINLIDLPFHIQLCAGFWLLSTYVLANKCSTLKQS